MINQDLEVVEVALAVIAPRSLQYLLQRRVLALVLTHDARSQPPEDLSAQSLNNNTDASEITEVGQEVEVEHHGILEKIRDRTLMGH